MHRPNNILKKSGSIKKLMRRSEDTSRKIKITQFSKIYGMQQKLFKEQNIVLHAYLKKQENYQLNNLTYSLKELEKEEQTKPKFTIRKEIIKIREEINKIETPLKRNKKENMRLSFLNKKICKPSTRIIKKKRGGDPNAQNKKWKRKSYKCHHRDTKSMRLL